MGVSSLEVGGALRSRGAALEEKTDDPQRNEPKEKTANVVSDRGSPSSVFRFCLQPPTSNTPRLPFLRKKSSELPVGQGMVGEADWNCRLKKKTFGHGSDRAGHTDATLLEIGILPIFALRRNRSCGYGWNSLPPPGGALYPYRVPDRWTDLCSCSGHRCRLRRTCGRRILPLCLGGNSKGSLEIPWGRILSALLIWCPKSVDFCFEWKSVKGLNFLPKGALSGSG